MQMKEAMQTIKVRNFFDEVLLPSIVFSFLVLIVIEYFLVGREEYKKLARCDATNKSHPSILFIVANTIRLSIETHFVVSKQRIERES